MAKPIKPSDFTSEHPVFCSLDFPVRRNVGPSPHFLAGILYHLKLTLIDISGYFLHN
ncbi:hypothetical protein KKB06_02050 [Patescibacteria group bacterium]|nr:hypothetical protein [Patescibacteria group bacterium]